MTARNDAPRRQIAEFCRRWQISEFAFIGRMLRGAADSRGGFDVLVRYTPEAKHTLFCEVAMERELADIFGCDVGWSAARRLSRAATRSAGRRRYRRLRRCMPPDDDGALTRSCSPGEAS